MGFTKEYIFPRKILLPGKNIKIPCLKLFQGEYLFSEGSSYFPINNYWEVLFFRLVLNNGYTGLTLNSLFDTASMIQLVQLTKFD